jgi:hypothetical protein
MVSYAPECLRPHLWLRGLVALRVLSIILLSLSNQIPLYIFLQSHLATIHVGAWTVLISRLLFDGLFQQFPATSILWYSRLETVLAAIVSSAHTCIRNGWRHMYASFRRREIDERTIPPLVASNQNTTSGKWILDSLGAIREHFRSFKAWLHHKYLSSTSIMRMARSVAQANASQEMLHSATQKRQMMSDDHFSGSNILVEMSSLGSGELSDPRRLDQYTPYYIGSSTLPVSSSPRAPSRVIVERGDQQKHDDDAAIAVASRDKNL